MDLILPIIPMDLSGIGALQSIEFFGKTFEAIRNIVMSLHFYQ